VNLGRQLRAVTKDVRALARDGVEAAKVKAREATPTTYEHSAEQLQRLDEKAKTLGEQARAKRDDTLVWAGSTNTGGRVGELARRFGGEMSGIPLLSLPRDLIRERSDITRLTDDVRQDPTDLYACLFLAEALATLERDMELYQVAQGIANPQAAVTRQAVKTLAGLGSGTHVPASERMLRRSYALATARLKGGHDADACHVIARVYLAKHKADVATKPAKLALSEDDHPGRGAFLVTLARAYFGSTHFASARRAAELAVEAGCSVGYQVLADLLFESATDRHGTRSERRRRFEELAAKVSDDDKRAYYGSRRSPWEIGRAVWMDQLNKSRDARDRLQTAWTAARDDASRRLDQLREHALLPPDPDQLPAAEEGAG
jgi:hypothetical protein